MLDAEDAAPLPQSEPVAVTRFPRVLVAAMVVLASAGTGYAGSRLWPLSAFSSPAMHRPAAGNTGSIAPVSREGAAPPSAHASKSAVIPDPIIPFDLPSPLQPSAVVSADLAAPVALLVAVTFAPATAPPRWSVTVPEMTVFWAMQVSEQNARKATRHYACLIL